VLLHGHPRTHATWHMVAARLASRYEVVCPDLRGYGESEKVAPFTKRVMALDVVGVMRALGHERFCVVGHDRRTPRRASHSNTRRRSSDWW